MLESKGHCLKQILTHGEGAGKGWGGAEAAPGTAERASVLHAGH